MSAEFRFPALGLRRALFFGLVLGTGAVGTWMMVRIVATGGVTGLELLILALFAPTFTWIALAFWTAATGFGLLLARRDPASLQPLSGSSHFAGLDAPLDSRTALAVPIFDEDASAVAARLDAMVSSLERTGQANRFDLHLLSDSRDPGIRADEERQVGRLRLRWPDMAIEYRHRRRNPGRKAGNIGEFCTRCVDVYDFIVVLDADSLMTGETLVRMARRMEANPRLGLLQIPTAPIRARSFFGRLVQFAGTVHGPLLAYGQAFWQGNGANYYGHNAIVRLRAFLDHARLPVLPGSPPLGGEILSHDFVEAALLRRAGWDVVMDPTVGGSWEEVPQTLPTYARRDRRWAQGSLQHLSLFTWPGLRPTSRLHFLFGAMGYLSSFLWLLILLAGTAYVLAPGATGSALLRAGTFGGPAGLSLLTATAMVLFLPKVLGLIHAMTRSAAGHGGAVRLATSAVLETVVSVLLAPVLMVHHTIFVTEIALGRSIGWEPRVQDAESLPWSAAFRASLPSTVTGVVWGGITLAIAPGFFLWMSPIFVGLILAAPLVRWTADRRLGLRLRRAGFLLVPSEVDPPREIAAVEQIPGADPGGWSGVLRNPNHGVHGADSTRDGVMYNAERGLFDLRRGRILRVRATGPDPCESGTGCDELVVAVEGLDDRGLARMRAWADGPLRLVLTRHRAHLLGWRSGEAEAVEDTVSIELSTSDMAAEISGLSSGRHSAELRDVDGSGVRIRPAGIGGAAALALVRLGRLLPAVVVARIGSSPTDELSRAIDRGEVLEASPGEIRAYVDAARSEIVRVSEASVPIPGAEASRFVLFREACGLEEHVAVLVGDRSAWPDPIPTRLHSACLTGDLFGSLRCDCGEQLRGSMEYFAARGGGILLYLAQEGRGIGLGNKFRAYSLQETGLDTIEADGALGFGADEREYDIAIRILRELGVSSVELLTNNPLKVRALEQGGVSVIRRQPLFGRLNRHNLPYVRAKADRAGHWLRDMLSQPMAGD